MKRRLCFFIVLLSLSSGCSKPESKSVSNPQAKPAASSEAKPAANTDTKTVPNTEAKLFGIWKAKDINFTAVFLNDHTGATEVNNNKEPFTWLVLKDGSIQITPPNNKVLVLKIKNGALVREGTKMVLFKAQ